MLIPYSDNNPTRRFPVVNYLLIAVNVAVFCMVNFRPDAVEVILSHALKPGDVTLATLLSSTFLHAGGGHLVGNMVFLHIYGDNVEDKLGRLGYLLFYLFAGAVSAGFHVATSSMPCIGASGAIAGVMGAYIILFPAAKIRTLVIFVVFFKRIELYSWFLLSLWFIGQLLDHFAGADAGIAFAAHIGGFISGTVVAGLLVLANLVTVGAEPKMRLIAEPPRPVPPPPLDLRSRFLEEKQRGLPCPSCVKAMHSTGLDGIELDHCFDCGGIWMDKGEAEAVLRRKELPYSLLHPPARKPEAALVPPGERLCCRCEAGLAGVDIEGVQTEGCRSCGGSWLPRGALGQLRGRLEPRPRA